MSKAIDTERIPRVGISCGDLNGIGLEVVLKAFQDNRMFQTCTPVLYTNPKAAALYRKLLNISEPGFHQVKHTGELNQKCINIISCGDADFNLQFGQSTAEAGRLAADALQLAVKDLKNGDTEMLVTAPINKHNIHNENFNFPGHTEYLAQTFGAEEFMMLLISERLKVGTLTGHLPVNKVSESISMDKICARVRLLNKTMLRDFGIRKPRIAVLGLNPHAGDKGIIGKEEEEIIIPALQKLREEGYLVFGPFGADGHFGSGAYRQFDLTLSMYHDQGLIPFKTISFSEGVNFTAGLPVVRTSPDHGTGYDIAGKNMADETSFRHALYAAADIWKKNREFDRLSGNPLKISPPKKERERGPN